MFNQQPERLWLALASETDTEAINKLLTPKSFLMTDDWGESRFTLKASLQSGEVVATCRLGRATTVEELQRHIGFCVPSPGALPVLTLTAVRAVENSLYEPLRLIAVVFAELLGMAGVVSDISSDTWLTFYRAERFTDLVKRCAKAPFDWEWQGLFPFEKNLPDNLEKLGSMHEFVRRTYSL